MGERFRMNIVTEIISDLSAIIISIPQLGYQGR